MTQLEKYLKDNKVSYYRVMKLINKNMGSSFKTKQKIQGIVPIDFNDLEKLCQVLSLHTKVPIEPTYEVKSVMMK